MSTEDINEQFGILNTDPVLVGLSVVGAILFFCMCAHLFTPTNRSQGGC